MYNFHPLISAEIPQSPESDFQIAIWPLLDHDPNDIRIYLHGDIPSMNRLIHTFEDVSGLSDDSSLHQMYLSNPPLKNINLFLNINCWSSTQKRVTWDTATEPPFFAGWDTWRSVKGVTFGQVFDYAKTVIRARHKCAFPDEHPQPQGPDVWGNWPSSGFWAMWEDWPTGHERRLFKASFAESQNDVG